VFDRLHGRRQTVSAVFHVPELVLFFDARAGDRRDDFAAIYLLGAGGALLIPPDRVLVWKKKRLECVHQRLTCQSLWPFFVSDRVWNSVLSLRERDVARRLGRAGRDETAGCQWHRPERNAAPQWRLVQCNFNDRDGHRPVLRRGGEERSIPAACLAARCNGR